MKYHLFYQYRIRSMKYIILRESVCIKYLYKINASQIYVDKCRIVFVFDLSCNCHDILLPDDRENSYEINGTILGDKA